jgi:uncharacterized protein
MKITVLVKAKAKSRGVVKFEEGKYYVSVIEPPVNNKANLAVIEALSEYFKVPKSKITLLYGAKSRLKAFEISKN